jgi:AcrR family transcriptional regulator
MKQDAQATIPRSERLQRASRARREAEKQELREVILKAASELFADQGYEGFSLRQVAERIGYSPGTIYLHYQNKDDLLFGVADEGFRIFDQFLQQAADSTTHPGERVLAVGRAYVAFAMSYPGYYRLMFVNRPQFLTQKHADSHSSWIETFHLWRQVIETAMEAGMLRRGPLGPTSDALWGMLHGIVSFAHAMESFTPERTAATLSVAFEIIGELCDPPQR